MKYTPPLNSTDPNASYKNLNEFIGEPGSIIPAGAVQNPQKEIVNSLIFSGITPEGSNLNQLTEFFNSLTDVWNPSVDYIKYTTKIYSGTLYSLREYSGPNVRDEFGNLVGAKIPNTNPGYWTPVSSEEESPYHFIISPKNDPERTNTISPGSRYYVTPYEYIVGTKTIAIFLDGSLLNNGDEYVEIGTPGYLSSEITFNISILPQNSLVIVFFFERSQTNYGDLLSVAKPNKIGLVKYDTETIQGNSEGVLSGVQATGTALGLIKIGAGLTIDQNGNLSLERFPDAQFVETPEPGKSPKALSSGLLSKNWTNIPENINTNSFQGYTSNDLMKTSEATNSSLEFKSDGTSITNTGFKLSNGTDIGSLFYSVSENLGLTTASVSSGTGTFVSNITSSVSGNALTLTVTKASYKTTNCTYCSYCSYCNCQCQCDCDCAWKCGLL